MQSRLDVARFPDERDALFRQLDWLPNPILCADRGGLADHFNRGWLDFTARTHEQERGNGWMEGVHPDDLDRYLRSWRTAFRARAPFRVEYRLRRHDGRYRWILDCGSPLYLSDREFAGYLCSCYDIQDTKEAEQLREDVMHLVTHELRNPLTTIRGYGELLGSGRVEDPDRCRDLGDRIVRRTEAMDSIIEELLTIERLRAGRLPLGADSFDPVEFAKANAEHVPLRNTMWIRVASQGTLTPLLADSRRLGYALTNLLTNAVKYSPTGEEILVEVSQADGETRFAVTDHGLGISRTDLDRLFGKFVRAENAEAQAVGGFGLGLYITQLIAEAHGGCVEAHSEQGVGSTFVLRVPTDGPPGEPSDERDE